MLAALHTVENSLFGARYADDEDIDDNEEDFEPDRRAEGSLDLSAIYMLSVSSKCLYGDLIIHWCGVG